MPQLIYDGSHWKPIIDIHAAKADGLVAVLYKCTEGNDIVDSTYLDAKTLCITNDVLFAAYHFGRGGSGTTQADFFLKHAQPDDKMIVALDWEATMGVAGAEQFVQRIHDILGRWPVVYTRKTYAEPLIGNRPSILTNCPLWVASYQSSPNWPKQWQTYAIQQYTNGSDGPQPHGLAGIGTAIDMNRVNPRFGDIAAWWGSDIATPPDPPVADKFVAPIGPAGLQPNGLWLEQPTGIANTWYDANIYENQYILNGTPAIHTGSDLNMSGDADKGQPIRAVCNGVILFADRIIGSSWGNLIIQESILPDGSLVWFRYAHSAPMLVKAGDIVTVGQHISDVSNAFGLMPYHLHVDVSLSGVLSRGYDGAVDWPGERRAYLEANYTDPYKWLLSKVVGDVPVTNIVTATVLATARVPVTGEAALLSTVIDNLTAGAKVQIDTDSKVSTQGGPTFYKISSGTDTGGFIAADCLMLPATSPVVRYVNVDQGSKLLIRSTGSKPADNSNVLPTKLDRGTKLTVIEPPNANGYVPLVTISGGIAMGWVADSLLSVNPPQ